MSRSVRIRRQWGVCVPLLSLSLLVGAQTAEKPSIKVVVTADEETGRAAGPSVVLECREANPVLVLGAVLGVLRAQEDLVFPKVSFLLRDVTVRERFRKAIWTTTDLVALHRTGKLPGEHQPWELAVIREFPTFSRYGSVTSVESLVDDLCLGIGYAQDRKRNAIVLGPKEQVGDQPAFVRRTYRLPEGHVWQGMAKLPARLQPIGACSAYDEASRLLVIIGEYASLAAFETILDALGGKRVAEDLFHSGR